jgi:diadenosine tetraphosphate (Ap4A) HIT family hydrolase
VSCVFCDLIADGDRLDDTTSEWVTFRPLGQVNDGHALIVPVRHVETFDELNRYEAGDLPYVLSRARLRYGALEYNLGVNAGRSAGQTVFHLHIHLIPREPADTPGWSPEGGIVGALGERFPQSQMAEYLRHDSPVQP